MLKLKYIKGSVEKLSALDVEKAADQNIKEEAKKSTENKANLGQYTG